MTLAHTVPPGDLEAYVYGLVSPLGGIKVWMYDSGAEWPHWAHVSSLQIDIRASSKKAARERAYQVHSLVVDLPWRQWDAGVVAKVEVVSGPFWEPDPDGAPRYVLRVSVTHRPGG